MTEKELFIQTRINEASQYIEKQCKYDPYFSEQVQHLDEYDFSEFLSEGLSLQVLRDRIEEKYDKEFRHKYNTYVFDDIDDYDFCMYLESRYNIWLQEYTDWVVRYNYGANSKARRRIEDSPGEMAQ